MLSKVFSEGIFLYRYLPHRGKIKFPKCPLRPRGEYVSGFTKTRTKASDGRSTGSESQAPASARCEMAIA